MLCRSSAADWVDVDRTADPGAFVVYLDAVARNDAVRVYKRQTFSLLAPRPGDRLLDVGCGTGDDARALASLVAPGGHVVGVDASTTMIAEARRRARGRRLPLTFRTGDAHRLDFADGTFDGARADRVFQHLDEPERALAELIRVTNPGGRIVLADTDWGTLAIDGPDRATTRSVLAEITARIRNPWMGRELLGLCRRAGLTDLADVAGTAVITDYAQADALFHLTDGLRRAREKQTVTDDQAARWTQWLEEAVNTGRFCCALTGFVVAGRRP